MEKSYRNIIGDGIRMMEELWEAFWYILQVLNFVVL